MVYCMYVLGLQLAFLRFLYKRNASSQRDLLMILDEPFDKSLVRETYLAGGDVLGDERDLSRTVWPRSNFPHLRLECIARLDRGRESHPKEFECTWIIIGN
jgi:hypothetical protein